MRVTVPIRKNGRVVIPRPVRDELELDYGDLIELDLQTISESEWKEQNGKSRSEDREASR